MFKRIIEVLLILALIVVICNINPQIILVSVILLGPPLILLYNAFG